MSIDALKNDADTPYDKAEALRRLELTMKEITSQKFQEKKSLAELEKVCKTLVGRKILDYQETSDGRHFYQTYYVYNPEKNNYKNPNRWKEKDFEVLQIYKSYNVDPEDSNGWKVYDYTTTEYDGEGRILKEEKKYSDGTPKKSTAKEYDANGKIKKQTIDEYDNWLDDYNHTQMVSVYGENEYFPINEEKRDMTTGRILFRKEDGESENLPKGMLYLMEIYNKKTGLIEYRSTTCPGNGSVDRVNVTENFDTEGKLTRRITEDLPKYDKDNRKIQFATKRKIELFDNNGNIIETKEEIPVFSENGLFIEYKAVP